MIDISKLNKAEVLRRLYNASQPLGLGILHFRPEPMTLEQAEAEMLASRAGYFDYLHGRVMKVNLSGPEFDPWGYDRDNGEGAARRALGDLL